MEIEVEHSPNKELSDYPEQSKPNSGFVPEPPLLSCCQSIDHNMLQSKKIAK